MWLDPALVRLSRRPVRSADMHVLDVARGHRNQLVVTVETDADVGGCPSCGVVAVGHGRRIHAAADPPCFGARTVSAGASASGGGPCAVG